MLRGQQTPDSSNTTEKLEFLALGDSYGEEHEFHLKVMIILFLQVERNLRKCDLRGSGREKQVNSFLPFLVWSQ